METMRDKGEGTITWRKDRARWQVAVTFPTGRIFRYVKGPPPPTALKRPIAKYAPPAAHDLLAELLGLRDLEIDVPAASLTLEAWLLRWIASLERATVKPKRPSTLRYYRMIATQHIIPSPIGGLPLLKLTPIRIQAWVDGMTGAPNSVGHRHAVLRAALNAAVRKQLIPRNPALLVDLPDVGPVEPPTLTTEQASLLISSTAEEWYGPLWAFLLATGVRIAEALGVIWDDVDFAAGTVAIDRQLAQDGVDVLPSGRRVARWIRVPVKASRKRTAMTLPLFALEGLRAHRIRMGLARTAGWTHFGHVFVTSRGRPPQETFILKALGRELERLALPELTTHQLRHTNATLMRAAGVDEQTRMHRLGHNTTAMARHYAHVIDDDDRAAAAALQKAIGGEG